MTIQVKFFARLREQLNKAECELTFEPALLVRDIWQRSTGIDEIPANILCAINMEYVSADSTVNDNDEVAFFPPVTGG